MISQEAVTAAMNSLSPNDVLYGDASKPISEEEMRRALEAAIEKEGKAISLRYPKTSNETLESLKYVQRIVDELEKYKTEMVYRPPRSGEVRSLTYAAALFAGLEELLAEKEEPETSPTGYRHQYD